MAYSFLVFDFDSDEDAAQQARHKIEGWKQGFRLEKKLQVKFDRSDGPSDAAKHSSKTKPKAGSKPKSGADDGQKSSPSSEENSGVRLIVRLDFSDHEKLSHQRWLDRIPTEEPFKSVEFRIVRSSDPEFDKTSDLFDSLDKHSGARARE